MSWSDYWGALTLRQRIGLSVSAAVLTVSLIGVGLWLLHDPYVALASGLGSEELGDLTRDLEVAKIDYRIGTTGDTVLVEQSQLGKARSATVSGRSGAPASVGLELFKETDFSSTDFAQRINYQRALQGELTRTIQTMAGVRSARVHVILADAGVFKRNTGKASAAVSVALQPGKSLAPAQVRGIQRLVAASVPEVKIEDVVVLDEAGVSLTRPVAEAEGELSSAQLDLKRQVDGYLQGKLERLLRDLAPDASASLSVDTLLDERRLSVTTEEPIATRGPKEAAHPTGVLVKERQSQRGGASGYVQAAGDVPDSDSTEWEYQYSVGRRMEQTLSAPGSIKRISVSVALQGAPTELSSEKVEQLVANAVGIDRSRGDSVAVLLLQGARGGAQGDSAVRSASSEADRPVAPRVPLDPDSGWARDKVVAMSALAAAALLLAIIWGVRALGGPRMTAGAGGAAAVSEEEIEAVAAKVRQWLNQESGNGR